MGAYQKERLENAVCYFAREHYRRARYYPGMTYMLKYLAHFEFELMEETGQPPLGLKYKAMPRGPVAMEIYDTRYRKPSLKYEIVRRVKGNGGHEFHPLDEPDMDYFSQFEIEKMDALLSEYAKKGETSERISDDSHKKVKAWDAAYYGRGKNTPIQYSDQFPGIYDKSADGLCVAEESFLVYSALKGR